MTQPGVPKETAGRADKEDAEATLRMPDFRLGPGAEVEAGMAASVDREGSADSATWRLLSSLFANRGLRF